MTATAVLSVSVLGGVVGIDVLLHARRAGDDEVVRTGRPPAPPPPETVTRDEPPARAAAGDEEWAPLPAVDQVRAWIDWVGSTASEMGWWHGGDGNETIQLPDGRVWHFFSDTYDGLVGPDLRRGSETDHLVNDSIVIRDADGGFLGQVWDEQIATRPRRRAPALAPDQSSYPGNVYWLAAGAVLEDGELRILASLMRPDPLEAVDTHILTLDTDDGSVTDVSPTGLPGAGLTANGTFEDGDWVYIHGQRPTINRRDGWAMLRAPRGDIRDLDAWQASATT